MSSAKWRPFCLGLNVLINAKQTPISLDHHVTNWNGQRRSRVNYRNLAGLYGIIRKIIVRYRPKQLTAPCVLGFVLYPLLLPQWIFVFKSRVRWCGMRDSLRSRFSVIYWNKTPADVWCKFTLQWRHNDHDSVSNNQPHDRLLNCLFGRRSKKTSKLRVTGLRVGNSLETGEFPAQMASNAENVSIWWRHHGNESDRCHIKCAKKYAMISHKCLYQHMATISRNHRKLFQEHFGERSLRV